MLFSVRASPLCSLSSRQIGSAWLKYSSASLFRPMSEYVLPRLSSVLASPARPLASRRFGSDRPRRFMAAMAPQAAVRLALAAALAAPDGQRLVQALQRLLPLSQLVIGPAHVVQRVGFALGHPQRSAKGADAWSNSVQRLVLLPHVAVDPCPWCSGPWPGRVWLPAFFSHGSAPRSGDPGPLHLALLAIQIAKGDQLEPLMPPALCRARRRELLLVLVDLIRQRRICARAAAPSSRYQDVATSIFAAWSILLLCLIRSSPTSSSRGSCHSHDDRRQRLAGQEIHFPGDRQAWNR